MDNVFQDILDIFLINLLSYSRFFIDVDALAKFWAR